MRRLLVEEVVLLRHVRLLVDRWGCVHENAVLLELLLEGVLLHLVLLLQALQRTLEDLSVTPCELSEELLPVLCGIILDLREIFHIDHDNLVEQGLLDGLDFGLLPLYSPLKLVSITPQLGISSRD